MPCLSLAEVSVQREMTAVYFILYESWSSAVPMQRPVHTNPGPAETCSVPTPHEADSGKAHSSSTITAFTLTAETPEQGTAEGLSLLQFIKYNSCV